MQRSRGNFASRTMTLDKLKAREGQQINETIGQLLEKQKFLRTTLHKTKLKLQDEKNKVRYVQSEYKKVIDERNDYVEKITSQNEKIKSLSERKNKIPTCDKSIIKMIEQNERETKELEDTITRDFHHTFDSAFRKKYTLSE